MFRLAKNVQDELKVLQRKLNRAETEHERDKIRLQIKKLKSKTVKSIAEINAVNKTGN